MLTDFEVNGFRSLQTLRIQDPKRVNILVGKSAAGKTAILESIRVALAGTPAVLFNSAQWRGALVINPGQNKEQFEAFWRPFFFNFEINSKIVFQAKDNLGRIGTVSVYLSPEEISANSAPQLPGMQPAFFSMRPIVFERSSFSGENSFARSFVNQGGVHFDPVPELGIASEFMPSQNAFATNQVANWFSALSIENKDKDIEEVIRKQFPDVTGLSVQAPQGFPMLYAEMKHQARKIPITSVSSGITKFISIMIAIKILSNGVLLIDEIENGIYFETFPSMWRTIFRAAKENSTQIFVTSHSIECIKAAASVLENEDEDSCAFFQIYQKEGKTKASRLAARDAVSALQSGIEVR